MSSHNLNRPSYSQATREEYSAFYERIEEAFNIEDMSVENLSEWLNSENHPMIDQFSLIKEIGEQIKNSETMEELRILRGEISKLPLHKKELMKRLDDKVEDIIIKIKEEKLARAIVQINEFSKKRNIAINENVKGGIYERWGRWKRKAVVIFKNGKIKAWEYM